MRTSLTRRSPLLASMGAAAALATAGLVAVPAPTTASTATPIVYVEKAVASGTFGSGTPFTNQQVTMRMVTNTADVVNPTSGYPQNRTGKVTVTVHGLGSATLTYGSAFVNQNKPTYGTGIFGFNGGGGFAFAVGNDALLSYNLDRPFGPVSGPSYTNYNRGAVTSNGGLHIASIAGQITFRAYIPAGG